MSMPRTNIVKVDLSDNLQRFERGVLLASADKAANKFGAEVYQDGKAATLTGYTVVGYFIRTGVDTITINGTVEGNKAYVVLPESCYYQDGGFTLSVKLRKSGYEQTLAIFDGIIAQTMTSRVIDSAKVIPILDAIIKRNTNNLLDNSNFDINQRGLTTYEGAAKYTVDRWKTTNADTVVNVLSNGIKLTNTVAGSGGYLQQTLENPSRYLGKTLTFAAMQTNGTLTVASATLPTAFPSAITQYATLTDGGVSVGAIQMSNNSVWVRVWSNPNEQTRSFLWAALYEGEYTAASLPPYAPKGYAAELLECQRHYLPLSNFVRFPVTRFTASEIDFLIPTPVRFRYNPTMVGTFAVCSVLTVQSGFSFTVAGFGANAIAIRCTKSGHGLTSADNMSLQVTDAALSADL